MRALKQAYDPKEHPQSGQIDPAGLEALGAFFRHYPASAPSAALCRGPSRHIPASQPLDCPNRRHQQQRDRTIQGVVPAQMHRAHPDQRHVNRHDPAICRPQQKCAPRHNKGQSDMDGWHRRYAGAKAVIMPRHMPAPQHFLHIEGGEMQAGNGPPNRTRRSHAGATSGAGNAHRPEPADRSKDRRMRGDTQPVNRRRSSRGQRREDNAKPAGRFSPGADTQQGCPTSARTRYCKTSGA